MKKILWMLGLLLCSTAAFSQKNLEKGNESFEKMEYYDAIQYYEALLKTEQVPEAIEKLAHCYRYLRKSDKAEIWYKRALSQPGADPLDQLYLAQCLLSNGKPEEALTWAQKYATQKPEDARGQNLLYGIQNRDKLLNPERRFSTAAASFSLPENDDFAPFLRGNLIYFTSDRGNYDAKTGWSGRSYTRLFQADRVSRQVAPTPGNINSNFHDGAACFSPDGNTMLFTRNNVSGKKTRKSTDNIVNLILVQAAYTGSEWALDAEFPFNATEYSTAYPCFSPDGNTLVFSSDMPGGQGGMDLYRCTRTGSGNWTAPENLGAGINTPGSETYPFVLPDGSLVFASDGLPGLGGQDLFQADFSAGHWANPKNLGAPINSEKDDFGFWCSAGMEEGWFSTNRNSPDALNDIFYFSQLKAPNRLSGLVVDKYTQIPLKEVDITATDKISGQVYRTSSGEDGQFAIDIPAGKDLDLRVNGMKNNIATTETGAVFSKEQSGKNQFVQLEHNDPRFTLEGFSLNKKDKTPIEGTLVKLLNVGTGETVTAASDAKGKFVFQLAQKSEYRITGEKGGYYSTIANASTKGLDRSTTLYVNLFLYTQVVVIGEEIAIKGNDNPWNIKDIYFDFNDAKIRPDAAKELDKLVAFLNLNANLKVVELGAHTDSRGSDTFNQTLSEKRAQSVVDYLVSKGISRSRLRAKGYGETHLVNRCADGIPCSEDEHQQNRRTEFKLLELGN